MLALQWLRRLALRSARFAQTSLVSLQNASIFKIPFTLWYDYAEFLQSGYIDWHNLHIVFYRYIWFKYSRCVFSIRRLHTFLSLKKQSLEDSIYCLNMLEIRHRYGRSETKLWTWFDMICFMAMELGGLWFPASKRQPAPRHALRWWRWDWRPAPGMNIIQIIQHFSPSSKLIPFTASVRTGKGLCSRSLCWCSALLGISGCWSERGQPELKGESC